MRSVVWEKKETWVKAIEDAYVRYSPEKAYLLNKDMISGGYTHGILDMVQVVDLLGINSIILRSRGIDPWEVLRG